MKYKKLNFSASSSSLLFASLDLLPERLMLLNEREESCPCVRGVKSSVSIFEFSSGYK